MIGLLLAKNAAAGVTDLQDLLIERQHRHRADPALEERIRNDQARADPGRLAGRQIGTQRAFGEHPYVLLAPLGGKHRRTIGRVRQGGDRIEGEYAQPGGSGVTAPRTGMPAWGGRPDPVAGTESRIGSPALAREYWCGASPDAKLSRFAGFNNSAT